MRSNLIIASISLLSLLAFKSEKYSNFNSNSKTEPKTYYIHPKLGNDQNIGTSKELPFKTLLQIEKVKLLPGDKVVLENGQVYYGSVKLQNQIGNLKNYIEIKSEDWTHAGVDSSACINFRGFESGIWLKDCSFIKVNHIQLTADGYHTRLDSDPMRCAILVTAEKSTLIQNIILDYLKINRVYFENTGFIRDKEEVKSANGTQKYGWGIRFINTESQSLLQNITIQNCDIADLSHTGIKLTGQGKNIRNVKIIHNKLLRTGGPGIQMSEVKDVYVGDNVIQSSGSADDSRKWGRGSGLWTWGSTNVMIEKNQFLNANGPGDSAGAHIDYNCDNIVIQYNLSVHNAGGFCEILGNNANCTYRYNLSVNDGYRVKGEKGAFQEGKTLWLSGYQGNKQPSKGPVNTYIYNNTIYTDASIYPKMAFDNTSKGVLIANNIFYLVNPSQLVLGDQYKPDTKTNKRIENVFFKNNLFLAANSWPQDANLQDSHPIYGNPDFKNPGGFNPKDYIPKDISSIKSKGIKIKPLEGDAFGAHYRTKMKKDILGNPVPATPSLGAIEPQKNQ